MSRLRTSLVVVGIAAAAVIALFWIGVLVAHIADAAPGTTPDWIAAIATLAAFGAAVVAGWYAHRALLLEQARDHERQQLAMRAQAELMTAWPHQVMYGTDVGGVTEQNEDTLQVQSVGLRVRNGSLLPITSLRFQVMHYVDGEPDARLLCERSTPFMQPNAVVAEGFTGAELARLVPVPDRDRGAYVRLTFTDAEGRRWHREGMGELEPIGFS